MTSTSFEYGREAFAFVHTLECMQSPDDVMDGMRRVLDPFGVEFFCFNDFPQPNRKFADVMWACRVPPEWLSLYLDNDYGRDDPSIRMCKSTVHPFEYAEARYDPEREPRAAEIVRRANEFGLHRGLLIPIPGPTGCRGNVWVGGYRPDLSSKTKPLLHLLALYAFDRVHRLVAPANDERPQLTSREREVLTWTALGKSAWEIGEILGISKRTVDEHAQTAFRKLGAANRTHAVAIAMRDRLIAL